MKTWKNTFFHLWAEYEGLQFLHKKLKSQIFNDKKSLSEKNVFLCHS